MKHCLILLSVACLLAACGRSGTPAVPSKNRPEQTVPSFENPIWSPDGKLIAYRSYSSGNLDIWVIQADGSQPINLTAADKEDNYYFAWSPSGDRIVYTSDTQQANIWLVNTDGTNPINLTKQLNLIEGLIMGSPVWSPDGAFIAFGLEDEANHDHVTIIQTVEWKVVRTIRVDVDTNLVIQGAVDWSPDGKYIVIPLTEVQGDFEAMFPQLWVFAVDDTAAWDVSLGLKTLLGNEKKLFEFSSPDWSPVENTIVFGASYSGGNASLFEVRSDGEQLTQITSDGDHCAHPTWSPDGKRIAFSCVSDPGIDIWVINADGNDPVNLTQGSKTYNRFPSWSPDGTKLAFQVGIDDSADIWIMNADGSGKRNLTGTQP